MLDSMLRSLYAARSTGARQEPEQQASAASTGLLQSGRPSRNSFTHDAMMSYNTAPPSCSNGCACEDIVPGQHITIALASAWCRTLQTNASTTV